MEHRQHGGRLERGTITGCTTLTPDQIAQADYGAYPANYQELVKRHFSKQLRDPYSAQYRFINDPTTAYQKGMLGAPATFGYGVCAGVNGKNAYGGYVGEAPYYLIIKDSGRKAARHFGSQRYAGTGYSTRRVPVYWSGVLAKVECYAESGQRMDYLHELLQRF